MKLWTLPRILGLVAGVLAWIAALIRYNKTGEVNVSLIAAGAFFALIFFSLGGRSKGTPPGV